MARSVWVGEVRTGRRITQIPVSGGRWSTRLRAAGDIEVQIPLLAGEFARMERQLVNPGLSTDEAIWRPGRGMRQELLAALDPARCFLAVLDGDQVIEAGPIWSHHLPVGGTVLTVRAAGMWSIFDHRRVMGVVADGTEAAAWSLEEQEKSLGTIARDLIDLAMEHAAGELPIDLPEPVAGAHVRTYNGYDLGVLGARLTELMNVEGGPDLALRPYVTPDRMGIRWELRAGTDADPLLHQHSGDWVLDAAAMKGPVQGIGVDVSATGLASRAWVTGEGAESALLMELADDDSLTSRGYPMLEVVESRHTIQERPTAASWAAANLAGAVRPWTTWTVQAASSAIRRNGEIMRPGDFVSVVVPPEHPYLRWRVPAGTHRARALEISGDVESSPVTVRLAPTMDVR